MSPGPGAASAFHPLFCFADATGETLSALLRPGNAGSNTVADHITVLDEAIAQLPAPIAVGHPEGDESDLVQRDVIMRADSAGCTEGFLAACQARNIDVYVSADPIPRSGPPSSMPSGSKRYGFQPSPRTAS